MFEESGQFLFHYFKSIGSGDSFYPFSLLDKSVINPLVICEIDYTEMAYLEERDFLVFVA